MYDRFIVPVGDCKLSKQVSYGERETAINVGEEYSKLCKRRIAGEDHF